MCGEGGAEGPLPSSQLSTERPAGEFSASGKGIMVAVAVGEEVWRGRKGSLK